MPVHVCHQGLDAEILLQRMREYSWLSCDCDVKERERERESKVQFSPTADLCSTQRKAETTRHTHSHSHTHAHTLTHMHDFLLAYKHTCTLYRHHPSPELHPILKKGAKESLLPPFFKLTRLWILRTYLPPRQE